MIQKVTLHNFCGFRDFTVELGEFTLLVGPNNSGKTTVLRAIKFALDACRRVFLPEERPNLDRFRIEMPGDSLEYVAKAGGITDLASLYFERDRTATASVGLTFVDGLVVHAECATNGSNVHTRLEVNGLGHWKLEEQQQIRDAVQRITPISAEFVPPPSTITATEIVMDWQHLQAELSQGKYGETWRNRLHWMVEGENTEAFQKVVNRVRGYMGDIDIRPPRRGKTQRQVEIIYIENGIEHDISAAGGGLRTLLTLATAIELSQAPILLFDEPDSHLHSLVQRQVARFLQESAGGGKQIVVTSHAPDFIEEVPVDATAWIDRRNTEAQKCDEIGRVLIDLGAVSHTQALASIGSDALVYVEGRPDRQGLAAR